MTSVTQRKQERVAVRVTAGAVRITTAAWAIAVKDLRIELRGRYALASVLPFAATMLLAFGFALSVLGVGEEAAAREHLRLMLLDGFGLEGLFLRSELERTQIAVQAGLGIMDEVTERRPRLIAKGVQPIESEL